MVPTVNWTTHSSSRSLDKSSPPAVWGIAQLWQGWRRCTQLPARQRCLHGKRPQAGASLCLGWHKQGGGVLSEAYLCVQNTLLLLHKIDLGVHLQNHAHFCPRLLQEWQRPLRIHSVASSHGPSIWFLGEKEIAERTFTGVLSSCKVALPGQNTISVQGAIVLVTSRRDAAAADCC